MKQLTEDLFAVEVPEDAITFDCHLPIMCDTYRLGYRTERGGNFSKHTGSESEFKIIGTVTADEIDFDTEKFVSRIKNENNVRKYADYKKNIVTIERYCYFSSDDSFRSFLTSKGINFVNPYGEKQPYTTIFDTNPESHRNKLRTNWQTAENALVKKIIIIQKVK